MRARRPFACLFALVVVGTSACVRARAIPSPPASSLRDVTLVVSAEVADIPAGAKELRLWIPVPRDEGAQVLSKMTPDTTGQKPSIVRDTRRGNGALLVVLRSPASAASARATYEISRAEQHGASPSHPLAHVDKDRDTESWLADETLTAVDDRIRGIAAEIFEGRRSNAEKARAAFDYVLGRRGDSSDVHALFIALMRAGKVPARFHIGFALPPDAKEGTLAEHHGWAEWWNPDHGWTPVDISAELFGRLDHDRVGVSLGRDLLFEGQQGPALDDFVFPYAEVDGQPIRVSTTVTFRDR